jgi:tripartite-type tricarboxylate transporter receptor subunit TctC
MARVLGQGLLRTSQVTAIVDNRPGADGAIAASAVIQSGAESDALFFATNTPIAAVPAMRAVPPYDPLTAFKPVAFIGRSAFFLYAHPSLGANSKEILENAVRSQDRTNFAAGNATGQLAAEQLKKALKANMVTASYKGEAPAITDLLGGRVQLMFASTTAMLDHARNGRLRTVATIGETRSELAPEVPTLRELGISDVSILPWVGVFASSKVSSERQRELHAQIMSALDEPETRAAMVKQGTVPEKMPLAQFQAFVASQVASWRTLVTAAGLPKE